MPDTSAINCLADNLDSQALIVGLRSGYFVRFPFLALFKVISTSSDSLRWIITSVHIFISGGVLQCRAPFIEFGFPPNLQHGRMGLDREHTLKTWSSPAIPTTAGNKLLGPST